MLIHSTKPLHVKTEVIPVIIRKKKYELNTTDQNKNTARTTQMYRSKEDNLRGAQRFYIQEKREQVIKSQTSSSDSSESESDQNTNQFSSSKSRFSFSQKNKLTSTKYSSLNDAA